MGQPVAAVARPDGNVVNFFTPVAHAAIDKFAR
jgi:hypothetical protein